jgi:hypothetical protein
MMALAKVRACKPVRGTMLLLSINTDPKRQTVTLDLLGKKSVQLSPADTRDVIAILGRSLKQLELSGREETAYGHASPANRQKPAAFRHPSAFDKPIPRKTHSGLRAG